MKISALPHRQAETIRKPASARPADFFQAAHRSFQRAAPTPLEFDYCIGGFLIRLRFANTTLVQAITPALAHLAQVESGHPALTICLWDSASTGVSMPAAPWVAQDYLARSEIRGYQQMHLPATYNPATGVLNFLDVQANLGLYWLPDAHSLPWYETGAPLLTLLHWWMRQQGHQVLHAAAIGNEQGGVLIAGQGGAGKSTTALACLNSDLRYVGDDYCLVTTTPRPYVWSLYNSGKVDRQSLGWLPHLQASITRAAATDAEKSLLFLAPTQPEKIVAGFPIRAVLLPHVTRQKTTWLTPASAAAACQALAPSTIFQLAGAGHATLQSVAALVRQVPCYKLHLGSEITIIPTVIASLLE